MKRCGNCKDQVTIQSIKQDPSDDIILRTAHDGKARYKVTGDDHLLSLKQYGRVKILTVSEVLKLTK